MKCFNFLRTLLRKQFNLAILSILVVVLFCSPNSLPGQITANGDYSPTYPGGSPWNIPSNVYVGYSSGATITAQNQAQIVANGWSYLGYNNGSTGAVTIADDGTQWINARQIYVGYSGNGTLTIEDGGFVSDTDGIVGFGATSTSTATVTGLNSIWESSQDIEIGYNGNGTLDILSSGTVNSQGGMIGRNANSTGLVTVNGGGSHWDNSYYMIHVGYIGNGQLHVENGGLVTSGNADIGTGSSSESAVLVTGANSAWNSTGSVSFSYNGDTTLDVEDGGHVSTMFDGLLARNSGSSAVATITGPGSSWDIGRNLYVGGSDTRAGGSATLNIDDGGELTVANTLKVWGGGQVNVLGGRLDAGVLDLSAPGAAGNLSVTGGMVAIDTISGDLTLDGGTLAPGNSPGLTEILGDFQFVSGTVEIEIGGLTPETEFDVLDIGGASVLNGNFDISLISSFTPMLGDTFDLVDAASLTGMPQFNFSNAQLAHGLAWDTSSFLADGSISVGIATVPEPGATTVLLLYSAGSLLRRRRLKPNKAL